MNETHAPETEAVIHKHIGKKKLTDLCAELTFHSMKMEQERNAVAADYVTSQTNATVAKREAEKLRYDLNKRTKHLAESHDKNVALAVRLARWVDLTTRLSLRLRQWCSYDEVVVTKMDKELLLEYGRLNEEFSVSE